MYEVDVSKNRLLALVDISRNAVKYLKGHCKEMEVSLAIRGTGSDILIA
jgi:hypothetical protein